MGPALTRLLPRALAVLLAAVVVVALVAPRNPWFVWPLATVRLATAAALVAVLLWPWAARRVAAAVARRPRTAVAAGTAVGGLLTAVHLPLAAIPFGWDAGNVFVAATNVAAGVPQSPSGLVEYFARFPNNVQVLALEAGVITVGSWLGLPALASVLVVQALAVTLVVLCLGSALVELGRPGAVWPVQGLATVLLGLNPHVAVPYSDVPAAACVALALWAAVRAHARGRAAWWVAALVFLVLGVALKPYVLALGVGALAMLPALVRRRGWLPALLVVGLAGGALAAGVAVTHAAAGRVGGIGEQVAAEEQSPFPPLHFMVMGTYDNEDPSPTRTYGGWHGPYNAQTRDTTDPDARGDLLRETLRGQLDDQGVLGTSGFLVQKVLWFWGDGTFYAYGEAADREQDGLLGERWRPVQQWFIGSGEPYRAVTAPLTQGVWLATLLVLAVRLWRSEPAPWVLVCSLALLVLTLYLTLFEARARYLLALLPVLLLLVGLAGRAGRAGGWTAAPRGELA